MHSPPTTDHAPRRAPHDDIPSIVDIARTTDRAILRRWLARRAKPC